MPIKPHPCIKGWLKIARDEPERLSGQRSYPLIEFPPIYLAENHASLAGGAAAPTTAAVDLRQWVHQHCRPQPGPLARSAKRASS